MAMRGQRNMDDGPEALPPEERPVLRSQAWRILRRAAVFALAATGLALAIP